MTQKPELLKEVSFVRFVYWLALLKVSPAFEL
jgi:hypothetical protein